MAMEVRVRVGGGVSVVVGVGLRVRMGVGVRVGLRVGVRVGGGLGRATFAQLCLHIFVFELLFGRLHLQSFVYIASFT